MGRQGKEAMRVANECRPWGRVVLERQGWPPPGLLVEGSNQCRRCELWLSNLWVHRRVCLECEAKLRASGCCPFDDSCARNGIPFCKHQGKCVKCEEMSCLRSANLCLGVYLWHLERLRCTH